MPSGMRCVAKDIWIHQSRIWQLNSVLWLTSSPCVIDPAYFTDEIEVISDRVDGKAQVTVVFSHGDFDHVVGAPFFSHRKIIAQENYLTTNIPDQLRQLHETDQSYDTNRGPFVYPTADITFAEQFAIYLGERHLLLFHTPGHTADSIIALDPELQVLVAGDMVSDIEFPFVYYSSGDYIASLKKMETIIKDYNIKLLVPGHGSLASGKREITNRLQYDREYLEELVGRVSYLFNAGMSEREIKTVLAEMRYRGEQTGGLLKAHLDNVKKVLAELAKY